MSVARANILVDICDLPKDLTTTQVLQVKRGLPSLARSDDYLQPQSFNSAREGKYCSLTQLLNNLCFNNIITYTAEHRLFSLFLQHVASGKLHQPKKIFRNENFAFPHLIFITADFAGVANLCGSRSGGDVATITFSTG